MTERIANHPILSLFLALFLAGNISGLQAQPLLQASLSTPANAGIVSESCTGPYFLVFERGETNDDTTLISISDFGDAIMGVDYTFPPGTFPLQMLPSDTTVIIPVTIINDGSPEGFEILAWTIAFLAGTEAGTITVESGITDEYEVEILSAEDTIEWCRFVDLTLNASSTAEIHWSPTFSFQNPTGSTVTVSPFLSGWYYATVGSDTCGAKDSIYLNLAIANILGPDTVYICKGGEGATLEGRLEGLATTFEWIPSDTTLSDPNILMPVATPTVTTTYILQSDFGVCIASDTVVVRVDSLPEDQHIDIAPLKAYYCAGEVVALFSPAYDSLDFPDITFNWTPNNGTFDTPLDLLNAALTLQDTTLYIRENINNACLTKDSILINVIPPSVPISVTDTTLCPGEVFDVEVLGDNISDPEWTPSNGLSCTKCLDPTVTVTGSPGSTIIYEFSGNILDCPVGAVLPITIPGLQPITILGDNVVCEGESIPLTIGNPAGLSNLNWSVITGSATLSCNDCPSPVVTINETGNVEILLTATTSNPNFCGAIGSFLFVPGEQVQIVGPEFTTCLDGTVVVSTGDPALTNVVWDVISGDLELSCTACPNPTVTVHSTGSLRFFAESNDPDVCRVSGIVSVSVFGGDVSNISLIPDPNTPPGIGQGATVTAILAVNPAPTEVTWTINGVEISSNSTTIEFNAEDEVNFIEATFINSLGCEQVDTLSFPTVPPSFMIPNAFTPNNDEFNNNFRIIINGNIVIEEFLVFNRWGQKVYDASESSNDGWDGSFKNEPAASDTYVYTATLRYPDGRKEVAKGDVILLK
jgi:gliding motility-associated-like protein